MDEDAAELKFYRKCAISVGRVQFSLFAGTDGQVGEVAQRK